MGRRAARGPACPLLLPPLPADRGAPARRTDSPRVTLSKQQAGKGGEITVNGSGWRPEHPADDADLRAVRAVQGRDRRHQLLRQRRRPGRHHRRQGRLQQEDCRSPSRPSRARAWCMSPPSPARQADGRRHLHGRRPPGRPAAEGDRRRAARGARRHPARRVEQRPAHLVRRPARARARPHRRQPRHRPRQGPGLPGRHLARRLRPAVGGAAVARHHRARQEGADQAPGRAGGRARTATTGLAAVRRQGAGRTALGGGPSLGRDPLLDPALRGGAGRGVPDRHGRRRPGAAPHAASVRAGRSATAARRPDREAPEAAPGAAPASPGDPAREPGPPRPHRGPCRRALTAALPWFTPESAPSENRPDDEGTS